MTTLEQFNKKHLVINTKITDILTIKIKPKKTMVVCKYISDALDISQQTVYNYITGKITDGYLAEAIYQELKKYKPTK